LHDQNHLFRAKSINSLIFAVAMQKTVSAAP
jgi:hypothetical protein